MIDEQMTVCVKEIIQETHNVKRFVLSAVDGNLPPFGGGSHIAVQIPDQSGNKSLLRHYSLIGSPFSDQSRYEIAVKKLDPSGGGSLYLHEKVKVGDSLQISGPYNYFPLRLEAKHHIFYAGGIGITPFLSMMKQLKTMDRSFQLHYFCRSRVDCPFCDELMQYFTAQSNIYFTSETDKTAALSASFEDVPNDTHLYICGPSGMIDDIHHMTTHAGYPNEHIHVERFSADLPNERNPFRVHLWQSKKEIVVAEDESLLDSLHKSGIHIAYACRRGICGTCEVTVQDGDVLHYDTFLTEDERKSKMLVCVSRGKDRITLKI